MNVAQLGERYEDARICIQPPRNMKQIDRPNPPELTERGVFGYGWTPNGVIGIGDPTILTVTLTPFAKPSSDALDKTVQGMKESIQAGMKQASFGEVERGRFGGFEARSGTYTGLLAGQKIIAYYLVGIDNSGSFAVTAMLPHAKAAPEETKALQSSILTFRRALPTPPHGPTKAP